MRQTCSPAVPNKSGPEAPKFEALETVLLILFPYMSWMLAEAMKLSGIVSILFCVIIMAHYTTRNLYPKTQAFRCAPPQFNNGHIGACGVSTRSTVAPPSRWPAAAGIRKFCKVFAFGCESFDFVYMGLAMCTVRTTPGH